MPKRKFPFEDGSDYVRRLKIHAAEASFSNARGEATWSPFNCSSHPAAANTIAPSPPALAAASSKKIQLFMNLKGQLCRTSQPSPSPSGIAAAAPSCCHSCGRTDSPRCCHFCEKSVCDACIQPCGSCHEEFCRLCSVKMYQSREDLTLCLTCCS